MAKVTEQDVINFLRQRVDQLTKDLDAAQAALLAFEESSATESTAKRGRKSKVASPSGARRGRKPKNQDMISEQVIVADQLG
jgi:hypothetical protein